MQLKYVIILFLVASVQACSTKVEKEINSVAKACEKPSKEIGLTDSSASENMRNEWESLYRIVQGYLLYGLLDPEKVNIISLLDSDKRRSTGSECN